MCVSRIPYRVDICRCQMSILVTYSHTKRRAKLRGVRHLVGLAVTSNFLTRLGARRSREPRGRKLAVKDAADNDLKPDELKHNPQLRARFDCREVENFYSILEVTPSKAEYPSTKHYPGTGTWHSADGGVHGLHPHLPCVTCLTQMPTYCRCCLQLLLCTQGSFYRC